MDNKQKENVLYITGAGVSAESGIPTFRGQDGYWTIGSINYTPQEMATRQMYQNDPSQFLRWYYRRFATYRNHGPNQVHYWLADKNLITQNIDGLDGKVGNEDYIAIHGRLDQMTLFHDQHQSQVEMVEVIKTPWDSIDQDLKDDDLSEALLELFSIQNKPQLNLSYKPFVLLFDEFYTDLYRITEAQKRMANADRIIFIGTSFSVNITQMALETAMAFQTPIEIVDPEPVEVGYANVTYHRMTALEYIKDQS
ncbi:MAG: SIR2 family NAD-dependent protein deacylase [Kangiellaceae bacterium]